jgi:hypothetical protein
MKQYATVIVQALSVSVRCSTYESSMCRDMIDVYAQNSMVKNIIVHHDSTQVLLTIEGVSIALLV